MLAQPIKHFKTVLVLYSVMKFLVKRGLLFIRNNNLYAYKDELSDQSTNISAAGVVNQISFLVGLSQ